MAQAYIITVFCTVNRKRTPNAASNAWMTMRLRMSCRAVR